MAKHLFPVYEFRPLPETVRGGNLYRYAEGKWIEDDGEFGLAFASLAGAPMAFGIDLPYRPNILWSWTTVHWGSKYRRHPRGNPWHYSLREGRSEMGDGWNRDSHPNTAAMDNAMNWVCGKRGCANGRGPRFQLDDQFIKAGLVREKATKEIVVPPESPICMYCGTKWLEDKGN